MSFEPSKLSGIKNEIVGAVKENVGWALGNPELENEGKITREQGHMERQAADETKATTSSSEGGYTEGLIEKVKEIDIAGSAEGLIEKVKEIDIAGSAEGLIEKVKEMGSQWFGWQTPEHEYESTMYGVFASIRGQDYHLKHPQNISDRSAPVLDKKGFKLRKYDRKPLFAEIRKGGWKLKHVDTFERKDLSFDQGFRLRKDSREHLFADIKKHGWNLKKVKTNDRSAPQFDKFERVQLPSRLLKDISGKKDFHLTHVSTVDKSAPALDRSSFKLNKVDRKPFLGEVKKGTKLKHVETCDKSGLQLPKSFHLTTPVGKTSSKKSKGKDRMDMNKSMGRTSAH
jgi:uncharacterized protein YjbJ (UPF0337 family)